MEEKTTSEFSPRIKTASSKEIPIKKVYVHDYFVIIIEIASMLFPSKKEEVLLMIVFYFFSFYNIIVMFFAEGECHNSVDSNNEPVNFHSLIHL